MFPGRPLSGVEQFFTYGNYTVIRATKPVIAAHASS